MPQDVPDFTTAAIIRPQPLGFIQPGIGATQTTTFQITAGTHAISLLTGTGAGLPTPQLAQSIKVHGNSSGVDYFVSPTPLTTFYQVVPVDSGRDISVDVTVQAQAAQDTRVYVSAIFDTQVVFLAGQRDLPLPAVDVSDRAARLVGVVQEGANPPLWQAPRALASVVTNVNGTVVVAGVAGQTVRVFGVMLAADAAVGVALRDGSQVSPQGNLLSENFPGAGAISVNHGGVPLGVGAGVILDLGAAVQCRACVSYSIG